MNLYTKFAQGLPYSDFLSRHGTEVHRPRWRQFHEQVSLTPARRQLLGSFTRQTNVMVLAGAWCGDCVNQCPIFDHFAATARMSTVRYFDRDEHADVQRELQINGGNRVPVVVFFSEDGFEAARFGERTLSKYRQMMRDQAGPSCPTGIVVSGDPLVAQVTKDWLDEFERSAVDVAPVAAPATVAQRLALCPCRQISLTKLRIFAMPVVFSTLLSLGLVLLPLVQAGDTPTRYPPPEAVKAAFLKLLDRPKVAARRPARNARRSKRTVLVIDAVSFASEKEGRRRASSACRCLIVTPARSRGQALPAVICSARHRRQQGRPDGAC